MTATITGQLDTLISQHEDCDAFLSNKDEHTIS